MKRYLLHLAMTALVASVLMSASVMPTTVFDATMLPVAKHIPASATAKIKTTTPKPTPEKSVTAITPAPVANTPPPFDPNNPATWPTCADNQQVWAEDGICHDKPVQAAPVAVQAAVASSAPTIPIADCGDNSYANYIYMHESGCRTHNPNAEGCDGIGQACPASKVIDLCGYDYACQNVWFAGYAHKYCYLGTGDGCWEGAYYYWVSNHWW